MFIAYLRVSTQEQAESGLSLDAQRSAIEAVAKRAGQPIKSWHADQGISGGAALDKRVALLLAIEDIKRGDTLIVAKRDRLARDTLLAAWVEKEVTKRGGSVESAAGEGNGDDPSAVLMRRIVDAFAEHERLLIRARTKAALGAMRQRGQRTGRHEPFGFRFGPDGRTMIPILDEQAAIERMLT